MPQGGGVQGASKERAPRGRLGYGSIRRSSSCNENAVDEHPPKEKRLLVGYILFSFSYDYIVPEQISQLPAMAPYII